MCRAMWCSQRVPNQPPAAILGIADKQDVHLQQEEETIADITQTGTKNSYETVQCVHCFLILLQNNRANSPTLVANE